MARIPIDDDENVGEGAEPLTDEGMSAQERASEDEGAAAEQEAGGDEVRRLKQERDALFDRLARTTAEFKNAQKRMQADFESRAAYANSQLIKSLLPVIDNFERALSVDPSKADAATILRGMQIVHDQWLAVLRQQQVEEIAPKPGDAFDPSRHEALMQQPAPQYAERREPVVTQLLQKGYALHGRTLRPAQVAVSKIQ